jgi:hypothetical protein
VASLVKRLLVTLVVVILVAVIAVLGARELYLRRTVKELTANGGKDLVALGSALPLVCTAKEVVQNSADFEVMIGALWLAGDVRNCGDSVKGLLACAEEATEATGRMDTHDWYSAAKSAYAAVTRYRQARARTARVFSAALARLKGLEAGGDPALQGVKQAATALVAYASDLGPSDVLLQGKENVLKEIERRQTRLVHSLDAWGNQLDVRYPSLKTYLVLDLFTYKHAFAALLRNEAVLRKMRQAKSLVRAEEADGCLARIGGIEGARGWAVEQLFTRVSDRSD